MSQNLTGSATIQASKAVINSLIYKNENISESIQPEMVKRTTLHPVYNDNDEIEERIYYTLHNDASVCTYVSPHIHLEASSKEITSTIPGLLDDDEFNNNDTIIIPYPPPKKIIIEDDNDDNGGGGGWWPGGGPGSKPGTGTTVTPSTPRTDFDNYAAGVVRDAVFIANSKFNTTRDVTDWYEYTGAMETAKFAMAKTRSRYNSTGCKLNETYRLLKHADDMYFNSYIEEARLGIPKVITAPRMFKNAPYLEKVTLIDGRNITNAESMCENCGNLESFIITNNHKLENAKAMFKNCISLKNVTFGATNSLKIMDHMFEGCKSPVMNPFSFKVVQSARYTFSGTSYPRAELNFPDLRDGSYMMYNCKKLNTILPASRLNTMETGTGMYKNCTALEKDETPSYFNLKNANEMYKSCKKLKTVLGRFDSLQNGVEMFKDCKDLSNIDINYKFPVIKDATGMFENCKSINTININFPTLIIADRMFKNCTGATTITVKADNLDSAVSMLEKTMPLGTLYFDAVNATNLTRTFAKTGSGSAKSTEGNRASLYISFDADINVNPVTAVEMFKDSSVSNFNNRHKWLRLTDASGMFENCPFLKTINFGEANSLTKVDGMFKDCSSLTSVTASFPNVVSYEISPFENCPRLRALNLSMDKLVKAEEMFRDCAELSEMNASFANLTHAKNMFRGCTSLAVPANAPEVTDAFGMYMDTQIDSVPNMPNIMTGRQTFMNCKSLSGHINASYTHLTNGINMFNGCDGITSVSFNIPANADVRNMFALCPNITSISGASFGTGVNATSMFMHSKVDYGSFMSVYNAIKDVEPVSDVNGCCCHVGVKADVIAQLEEAFGDIEDADGNPLFENWEGNQYSLRLNTNTNVFVMAVVN